LECQSPLLNNFETFLEEFGAFFDDSNKERTSTNKLRTLHQGTCPTSMYASKFRQPTCDISWDKATLMNQFQFGFNGDVKDLPLTMHDPTTLNQTIARAMHCDN
jgi:hypothetical protein